MSEEKNAATPAEKTERGPRHGTVEVTVEYLASLCKGKNAADKVLVSGLSIAGTVAITDPVIIFAVKMWQMNAKEKRGEENYMTNVLFASRMASGDKSVNAEYQRCKSLVAAYQSK